jgi:hypothetical protein
LNKSLIIQVRVYRWNLKEMEIKCRIVKYKFNDKEIDENWWKNLAYWRPLTFSQIGKCRGKFFQFRFLCIFVCVVRASWWWELLNLTKRLGSKSWYLLGSSCLGELNVIECVLEIFNVTIVECGTSLKTC